MRFMVYCVVFLLGGLTALTFNTLLFSRQPVRQAAISEGAASASAIISKEETINVSRVIDGDTIELADGRRVRYIGIDTPEMGDSRKQVQCFAWEATEENKRLVEGKTVRLEKDVSDKDRYGRLLRYVYVGSPAGLPSGTRPAGEFVNDNLVRQGFALVATFPPDVRYFEEFLDAEREARERGRGLWNQCLNPTKK